MWFRKLISALIISVLMSAMALGAGVGNVELEVGSNDQVWPCGPTTISVYFKNDAPLYGFSLGFDFSAPVSDFHFVQPIGTLPPEAPVIRLEPVVHPNYDIDVDISQLPNRIFISGSTIDHPLPATGAVRMLVFRFIVYFESQEVFPAELCIDNIVHPVSQKWMFYDVTEYAPTFYGSSNNSMTDPSAAAECFDIYILPLSPPYYTSTPATTVSILSCDTFTFDFDGDHSDPNLFIYFDAAVGVIDPATGVYQLPPDGGTGAVVDTIGLFANFLCDPELFIFTINRTNVPPQVNNCRPKLFVQEGTAKAIDYDVSDADTCDTHEWSLTLLSGTPPTFPVSIDPATGVLVVDATGVTSEETFDYQVTSTDASNSAGTDIFQLKTTAGVPGDANSSGTITVSDAALIIMYIFMGGPPPLSEYGADPDCSGGTSISDAVHLVTYIFSGGLPPCGVEP